GVVHAASCLGAPAFAKSRGGDGAGLRAVAGKPGAQFGGGFHWHSDRSVRGRLNQHLMKRDPMSPVAIFQTHLVLGYVEWLLCFSTYIWVKLSAMNDLEAQ